MLTTTRLATLDARIWEHARPPRRLPLAPWAAEHFVLPAGDANAGHWMSIPYQQGILNALTDPSIERVSIMKSARVGYTKMMQTAIAYHMVEDPCPIMVVQPTIDDAEKFSKEDIAPMLRDVPILRGIVAEPKSRDAENTMTLKMFPGGSLLIVGANSPRGFRRTSRRIVVFDEVDGYNKSAGAEGDPYKLGEQRTVSYWNRKIIAGSTPTSDGKSRIEELFLQGDQRRRYVPCPECGEFQVLTFENLRWSRGSPETAHFVCTANGCMIEEEHKREMDAAGEWRAEAPGHFTPLNRHASFHIWAAYSYSANASWPQLAAEFEVAKKSPLTHKTFRNTVEGGVWREALVMTDWEMVARRREPYPIGTVPWGVLFLTAGVDVQKDRLVYEVVGWGRGRTSWSIDAGVLMGETSLTGGPWAALDAMLSRTYPHPSGLHLSIRRLAVDSGYNTQHVYAWARRYPFTRVIPVKGQEGISGSIVGLPKIVEVTGTGHKPKRGYRHWPVFGHVAKDELFGFLRLEKPTDGSPPPPGYCHFPEYDDEFFRQLTAEELVPSRDGRWHMYKPVAGRENHALDARVYARAAACAERMDWLSEAAWRALEDAFGPAPSTEPNGRQEAPPPPSPPPQPAAPPRTPFLRAKRDSWLAPRR